MAAADLHQSKTSDAKLIRHEFETTQLTIKAKHLKRGDTVGLIAPASPFIESGTIEYVYQQLSKLGLKYKVGKHVFDSYGDKAGIDDARLEDFHTMWADPEVHAIIPLRGGNGSYQILPKIDLELIKNNPKIFIGYSDLTGLLNYIHRETGLITFHGPMAASFYRSSYSLRYFVRSLMSNKPIGSIRDPLSINWPPRYPPPRMVISEGQTKAVLAGGCLSLIRQFLGTPYEIDFRDKILFIEDLYEEPHSIDRYLTQLLLSGKLQQAKGIIVSEMVGCSPGQSGRNSFSLNHSLETVLKDRLANLGIPVVYGLRFGHGDEQFTLPIGVRATLEASHRRVHFRIEESATK